MDLKEAGLKTKEEYRHPWEKVRVNVIEHLLKKNVPFFSETDMVIVDVGCGDTYVSKELSQRFRHARFFAIDHAFDEKMIQHYQRDISSNSIQLFSSLQAAKEHLPDRLDIILLLDVIEHVHDDVVFLRNLKEQLCVSEETLFVVVAPAFQSLYCSHDKFLGHCRRYNKKTLKNVFEQAGLLALDSGYFFLLPLMMRSLKVFFEKVFQSKKEPSSEIVTFNTSKSVNSLIRMVLNIDFTISFLLQKIGISLPGLSNYAVCKKSV